MIRELILDPVLEAVCRTLDQEEYSTLESQLLRDGCLDALRYWYRDDKKVLLDGHNRLKICEAHNLPYKLSPITIDNIDEAIIWIIDNQKGRRNESKEHAEYLSGKRYEAQKNINRRRDKKGVFIDDAPGGNDFLLDNTHNSTAKKQAHQEGISERTIRKNAEFASGVDAVREVSPKLAEKILKPEKDAPKLTKHTVSSLPKLKKKSPKLFVDAVKKIDVAMGTNDPAVVNDTVLNYVTTPLKPTYAESKRKFDEFNQKVAEKTAEAHKQIDAVFGSAESMCFMPNVSELWCNDCKWGFDVFLPVPSEPSCPYCTHHNIAKRDHSWNPRKLERS